MIKMIVKMMAMTEKGRWSEVSWMMIMMKMVMMMMMMVMMLMMMMMMIKGREFRVPGSMACSAAQDGNAEDIIPIKRTITTTIITTIIMLSFVVLLTCGCSGTVV